MTEGSKRRLASIGRAALFSTAAALVFDGCTAGYIVDKHNRLLSLGAGTYVTFVPVDANGNADLAAHVTCHTGAVQVAFACDPAVPSSLNVNGTGMANVSASIPEGDYYVVVAPANTNGSTNYVSPIFHHAYSQRCTDYFTQRAGVPCAQYEMKIYPDATWQAALGSSDSHQTPPAEMQMGVRVVPLLRAQDGRGPEPQGRVAW